MADLNDNEKVEVVLKKQMTYADYKRIFNESKKKGWTVQAYQIGVYSDGQNKQVK